MAKEKTNKVKRLGIRLTEEELCILLEKAKKYPSVSALVIDAVLNHDVRRGRNRIDTMIKFSDLMEKSDTSLSRIGNNINQITKEIHRQRLAGIGLSSLAIDRFLSSVEEANRVLTELLLSLRSLSR